MLGWLGLLLTVLGLFLNGRKIIWCFPVWIASNVAWIASGVPVQVIVMNLCMFCLNITGWRNWARKSTGS